MHQSEQSLGVLIFLKVSFLNLSLGKFSLYMTILSVNIFIEGRMALLLLDLAPFSAAGFSSPLI